MPAYAQAYSLNFTAVPHSKSVFLTIWPSGQSRPGVSTLNASTGAVTANAAIVPAGLAGDVSVFATDNGNRLNASTLNAMDGTVTLNLAIVPSQAGSINAFASSSTHLILDVMAYFAQ